ncbi:tripartite tricarboxylate transporter substrate binding protein [Xylophilus sp. GOD-11R]|uniref:tripartite tricarboxylate transporter substrate binding protein n=1 Tax=Xylophilus sp. GOD-11R TaxID=3089814 RepID=UPI00298C3953|nr:tripartite tricarboxylate transporter substrate binding protein [Xylophilus sp. GOD-11R]WPB55504.1 tripartite tricarboxylate transporter substrate binding protein [Xylophilus sp. GOD-11R]
MKKAHVRRMRRGLLALALGLSAGLAQTQPQKPWPDRAIRLIVPFAAGSAADTLSRTVATRLAERLGQPVTVDNKGGAGGTIGTTDIARAAPDGYTLGVAAQGTLVNNLVLYARPGYDPLKDFAYIAHIGDVQNVLVVKADAPYANVAALLDAVREQPDEHFKYSSSGAGTSHHVAGVLLAQHLRKKLLHVPYTGAPQGLTAILSGDVDLGLYNLPAALGLIGAGKLKPLAVTGPTRATVLPALPTLAESGLDGYSVTLWWGVIAPAALPPAIAQRLNDEINRILAEPEVRKRMADQGFTLPPLPGKTREQFAELVRVDIRTSLPLLRQMGLSASE